MYGSYCCVRMTIFCFYIDVVRSRGNSALSAHSSDALPECPSTPTPSGGNAKRYAYLDPVYFNEQVMGISQYKDIHEDKICGIVGKSWKNRQFLDSKLIRKLVSAAIDRYGVLYRTLFYLMFCS